MSFPLVSDQATLQAWLESHNDSGDPVCLDTEADSLHCYHEKLCLIQVTVSGETVLIDPLQGLDLEPLMAWAEPREVVFHAADYDLKMLSTIRPFLPATMRDTSIAARLLGYRELGLAALLEKVLGVQLAKTSQKANWAKRPLTEIMIEYAANDTMHLQPLMDSLATELKAKQRWHWFEESCERAVRQSQVFREKDEDRVWRISGYAKLKPRALAVLRALWQWREQEAAERDRPTFHVLRNEELLRAAICFDEGKRFSSAQLKAGHRKEFETRAREALKLPEEEWPRKLMHTRGKKATEEQEARLQALKTLRDEKAEALELDGSVIAPRAALERAAYEPPRASELLMNWQLELLELPKGEFAEQSV
ncbi:MAG: ribonuclease D [Verrucomicrobiales bacterium]